MVPRRTDILARLTGRMGLVDLPDGEPAFGPWRSVPVTEGSVEVPATASLLVVEGVGAARRALAPLLDATVWVQTDRRLGLYRGIARDGAAHRAFWDEWEARERPFLAEDRPWERADLVVSGAHEGELVAIATARDTIRA
jgi:CBS domain-containing protein